MKIYLLKRSPYNEDFLLDNYAVDDDGIRSMALKYYDDLNYDDPDHEFTTVKIITCTDGKREVCIYDKREGDDYFDFVMRLYIIEIEGLPSVV